MQPTKQLSRSAGKLICFSKFILNVSANFATLVLNIIYFILSTDGILYHSPPHSFTSLTTLFSLRIATEKLWPE